MLIVFLRLLLGKVQYLPCHLQFMLMYTQARTQGGFGRKNCTVKPIYTIGAEFPLYFTGAVPETPSDVEINYS